MFVQGYNAQAVVDHNQIVIAAEVSTEPVDFSALEPLIRAASRELEQANISSRPRVAIADAGFWNEQQIDKLAADGIAVLVPPESGKRKGQRPGWSGGRYSWMRGLLSSDHGRELYRQRRQVIEPVFGHTKHNRKFTQKEKCSLAIRGDHMRATGRVSWNLCRRVSCRLSLSLGLRVVECGCQFAVSGTRSPKWILNASSATVQFRVVVHAGTALVTAR